MTILRSLTASALLAGGVLLALPPGGACAQVVNPSLPMTAKPPGLANPKPIDPAQPIPDRNQTGVIKPPPMMSRMPVIHPTTPSRMPVIPPPGTPGGNQSIVPK